MQFELDDDQKALQETVQRFLAQTHDFEKRRALLATPFGHSPELWRAFAEQGFLSIGLPESHGGLGGQTELMLVMEELGRSMVLEPVLSTLALCAPLVAEHGTPAQRAELLPRIAAGELKLALAHGELDARYDLARVTTTARRDGAGYLLNGAKHTVADAAVADLLLVTARTESGALAVFLVAPGSPGSELTRYRTHDGRSAADISLHDVRIAADRRLGDDRDAFPALERAIERGIAAACADAVGAMEAVNQATIEYTKSRKQFGQPIGRFQALQHRMADMFVYATQARSMSILANARCASGDATLRRRDIAAAKCYVGKAARFIGQQAVQLHGGMGMADELAVSHWFKRLTLFTLWLGDIAHHRAVFGETILAETNNAGDAG
jgi:alkylation response protein AidB-like acyl-CoA dehydrogenase